MSLSPQATLLLKQIVYATCHTEEQFLYTSQANRAELTAQDLIECRDDMIDPNNPDNVATRATKKGIILMTETTETNNSEFEIESDFPVPSQIRSNSKAKYNQINDLKERQCFHVALSEGGDLDDLAKSIGAVVSNANKKYRVSKNPAEFKTVSRRNRQTKEVEEKNVEVTVPLRIFTARRVDEKDKKGVGVRIFRLDLVT